MANKKTILAFIISMLFVSWGDTLVAADKKKIIFTIHNETLYGKGFFELYTTLKKRGHDIKVIAVPYLNTGGEVLVDLDLPFLQRFDKEDVIYPCGKQQPYKSCAAPHLEKADYMIVGNPYNTRENVMHPHYTLQGLKKLANKTMYFVYGPHLFSPAWNSNPDILNTLIDVAMVDSESTKELFMRDLKFKPENVIVSGYLNYKNVRDKVKASTRNPHYKETILWLPRWTLSTRGRDQFEGGSSFLNYFHFMCNFAEENPEIRLIVRPHIALFQYNIAIKYFSQKDVDAMVSRMKSIKNIVYSEQIKNTLEDDVVQADIVISDGTSALGEVVVADKPIIYLSNGWDTEFNSNELSKEFKSYLYMAHEPSDILKHLDFIRKTKYAPFAIAGANAQLWQRDAKRDEFKKKLDPVYSPAHLVAEYVETH
jgi:hypothetical protein